MKLKTAVLFIFASAMLTGTNANANLLFDVYAGLSIGAGGISTFADGTDTNASSQSNGAVLGIDIPVLRFEAEYNYLNNKDVKLHIGMINAYAKMSLPVVKPYLGVGIGSVFDGKIGDTGIKVESVVAYQAMLGITFDIPVLPIDVDVEARALYAADLYNISEVSPDIVYYDLRLKLRYTF